MLILANDYEYPASSIPDSLKTNADAVIREYSAVFTQSDPNNATFKVTKVVTVLNEDGESVSNFYFNGDKFRNLSNFSGIIRNGTGKELKKIKKGDLTTSSISDMNTFASDNYTSFYEYKSPVYPYTIEYKYEEKWKGGLLSYPWFAPVVSYDVSVESAKMQVEIPVNTELRYKKNFDFEIENEKTDKLNVNIISLNNFKAIKSEPFSPSFREIAPLFMMAPSDFCYDSHCGNMTTWESYGAWVAQLLKGRDELPVEFVNKLKELTANANNDREKVKIIYEYLQGNTRYISVQYGIGGFQPFPAQSVLKAGFGDCKGLSNYMKAMLKAVGITSNYCEIGVGIKDLHKDYTNVNQTNHVILLVPLKNDSIWLECTSQTKPFGYVPHSIAGCDALVVNEVGKGGTICKLPVYENVPTSCTKLILMLAEDGSVEGKASFNEKLKVYEKAYWTFTNNDRTAHVKYINGFLKIPGLQVTEISTSEDRSSEPSVQLNTSIAASNYANKTGSRLFVPLCPIDKGSFKSFSSSERTLDIEFDSNFHDSDTVIFTLPESYIAESLPKDVDLNTPFGIFQSKVRQEGNMLIYTQVLNIPEGRYDKSTYQDLKAFYSEIDKAMKRKLVLKKQL